MSFVGNYMDAKYLFNVLFFTLIVFEISFEKYFQIK